MASACDALDAEQQRLWAWGVVVQEDPPPSRATRQAQAEVDQMRLMRNLARAGTGSASQSSILKVSSR